MTKKLFKLMEKWPRITIKQIALVGIFLSLMTVFKLLDIAMFKINGYAIWELYYTVGALAVIALPLGASALMMIAAPFLWLAIGQVSTSGAWSMFFDYFLPLFGLLVIKLATNRYWSVLLVLLAGVIKFLAHTVSGKLFFDTEWVASMIFNAPFCAITVSITLVLVFFWFNKVSMLKQNARNQSVRYYVSTMMHRHITDYQVLQRGYLNKTYRFELDQKPFIIKIANRKVKTLQNEFLIAAAFYPEALLNESQNVLIRPYVEGQKAIKLNALQKQDLISKLQTFNQIDHLALAKHDWSAYDKFRFLLPKRYWKLFLNLRQQYQAEPLVPSHNDLNAKNIVVTDQAHVALIDFEWARLNAAIFDLASFYVYENDLLDAALINSSKFHDYVAMIVIFSYLWTYAIPFSLKAYKLRIQFWKKLKKLKPLLATKPS